MKLNHTEIANLTKAPRVVESNGRKFAFLEVVTTEYNKTKQEDEQTYLTIKVFIPSLVQSVERLVKAGALVPGQTVAISFKIGNEKVSTVGTDGNTYETNIPSLLATNLEVVGPWLKTVQELKAGKPAQTPNKPAPAEAKPAPAPTPAPAAAPEPEVVQVTEDIDIFTGDIEAVDVASIFGDDL